MNPYQEVIRLQNLSPETSQAQYAWLYALLTVAAYYDDTPSANKNVYEETLIRLENILGESHGMFAIKRLLGPLADKANRGGR